MPNYNPQQEIAVTYPAQPLLILAGAGTGKTTTIVGRIAYLIQHKEALPESILALTFTNDAAENMKRKLAEEIGLQGNEIHACTFHAFAQSQTMRYFQYLGYTEKPKVMNRGDIYFLIRRRFDDLGTLRSKTFSRNPIWAVQSFQKVFEAFRYNLLDNQELHKLQQAELDKISFITDEKELERKEEAHQQDKNINKQMLNLDGKLIKLTTLIIQQRLDIKPQKNLIIKSAIYQKLIK